MLEDKIIYPVILAGGSGTRLWPRSREKSPKQFIPLIDGKSLFQETCIRFNNPSHFRFLTIVTHEEHRFLVRDQLTEIGIYNARIITEPEAKNTAAACLAGALFLQQVVGDVPIIFTPADHIISNEENLLRAIDAASPFVTKGSLCVFGITPTSPHTGYGYILGSKILAKGIMQPEIFIEKPEQTKAQELIKKGALWNSGLYFCTTTTLTEEANLYLKDQYTRLQAFFITKKTHEHGFVTIDKKTYDDILPISIDKGITERTKRLILAKTDIKWNDLGSWTSLYNHFDKDEYGNVVRGDTVVLNTKNSYIESTKNLVTVFGLEHIGVVETPDAIMVFPLHEGESVKKIVGNLSEKKRKEIITHTTVHRPWGKYTILGDGEHYQSKNITVLPGAELSLQRHKHRAEHWVVVRGIATVTKDNEVFELKENESTFIPKGVTHRLQNKHSEILSLIEIQTGSYFGEDDIERFHDTYGRV